MAGKKKDADAEAKADPQAAAFALNAMSSLFGPPRDLTMGNVPGVVTTEAVEANLPQEDNESVEDMSALDFDNFKEEVQANFDLLHQVLEPLDSLAGLQESLATQAKQIELLITNVSALETAVVTAQKAITEAFNAALAASTTPPGDEAATPAPFAKPLDNAETAPAKAGTRVVRGKATQPGETALPNNPIPQEVQESIKLISPPEPIPVGVLAERLHAYFKSLPEGGGDYPKEAIVDVLLRSGRVDQNGNVIPILANKV